MACAMPMVDRVRGARHELYGSEIHSCGTVSIRLTVRAAIQPFDTDETDSRSLI